MFWLQCLFLALLYGILTSLQSSMSKSFMLASRQSATPQQAQKSGSPGASVSSLWSARRALDAAGLKYDPASAREQPDSTSVPAAVSGTLASPMHVSQCHWCQAELKKVA